MLRAGIMLIRIAAVLVLFALPAYVAASTVTLSGSCPGKIINTTAGTVLFNLSNSGNGAATGMSIQPSGQGMMQSNALFIQTLAPGSSYLGRFLINATGMHGSYAENFAVAYSQDSSSFSTFFPCTVYVGTAPESAVFANTVYYGRTLRSDIMSGYNGTLNLSVLAVLPYGFYTKMPVRNVTLVPYGSANITFNMTLPGYSSASLPAALEVSYSAGGTHYAYISTVEIGLAQSAATGAQQGAKTSIGLPNIAFLAAVAAVIFLIAASILMKRRKPRPAGVNNA